MAADRARFIPARIASTPSEKLAVLQVARTSTSPLHREPVNDPDTSAAVSCTKASADVAE
jgi:hypothetical protein